MAGLFLFPFEKIEKDSKIIIYGAGNVGRDFYSQIRNGQYCDIVLWVDRDYQYFREYEYPVSSIDEIKSAIYDVIIIAINDENIACNVRNTLIRNYDVSKEKIIWGKYDIINPLPDFRRYITAPKDEACFKEIAPQLLINSNAMEHMVRYLFCRDIINRVYNQHHLSLYQRFVMTSTAAIESFEGKARLFSDYEEKRGLENYVVLFQELVASMEKEGFLREYFLPLGNNGYLANGKHRYAAALALEKKIWIKEYRAIPGHYKDISWFRKNGFTESDILVILRTFCDLYQQCGIFILYGPVIEYWNYITVMIERNFKVAGYADLNFKDDYIGFANLVRDNYGDNERNFANIEEKIHFLLMSPLKIRVLVVTDEGMQDGKQKDFYVKMGQVKKEIRNHMFSDTAKHTVIVHGSNGFDEFVHMKNIWLNENNIAYAGKRVLFNYGKMFMIMLNSLKKYLRENKIPLYEICILGSAGMELYGLKCADDIDFCVSMKYRNRIDTDMLPLNVHLKSENSVIVENEQVYPDDLIINDPEFHFIYSDLKFLNLDLLYGIKKRRKLKKDADDIRRLEVFFDSVKAFNDKRQFREQMEREVGRTW